MSLFSEANLNGAQGQKRLKGRARNAKRIRLIPPAATCASFRNFDCLKYGVSGGGFAQARLQRMDFEDPYWVGKSWQNGQGLQRQADRER